jgi:hypothetical protein
MAVALRILVSVVVVLTALVCADCGDDNNVVPYIPLDPGGPAIVQTIPTKVSYSVGETITIMLMVDNAANVDSVAFHLLFNEDVMRFVPPAVEGPFLRSDGADTVFLCAEAASGGDLVVGASRLSRDPGIYGGGQLATFRFEATSQGECRFQFTHTSVKDPQARYLPAVFVVVPVSVI